MLRGSEPEARHAADEIGRHNGGWDGPGQAWKPERLAEKLAPYMELGFTEIYLDVPAPFDEETLTRFIGEVKPMLEGSAHQPPGRGLKILQPSGDVTFLTAIDERLRRDRLGATWTDRSLHGERETWCP